MVVGGMRVEGPLLQAACAFHGEKRKRQELEGPRGWREPVCVLVGREVLVSGEQL